MKQKGFTLIEVMIVIAILAIIAAVVAPVVIGTPQRPGEHRSSNSPVQRGGLWIYTDPDTGCQYLQGSDDRQLTPRLGPDGHQLCQAR